MRIAQIEIKNFRSIKSETIVFPDRGILALVGPNNAGKSNILKAINNLLGDAWFSKERAEKNDYYQRDLSANVLIRIIFDDGKRVELDFGPNAKWPTYYDANNNKIYASKGSVKEDFPCTFLPAERSLEKNLQFRSYEIMGKIAKAFNEKADNIKDEIEQKFNDVMSVLNTVDGFTDFKEDFVKYFNEMQADTPYRLKVDFKAFSPLNYFRTISILANDSSVNNQFDIDVDELGEGNKSLLLFALLRSYAKNFKQEAAGILAIEEPEIYLHPQARRHLFDIFLEIVKDSNIQIIYTTHSPDFVATEYFDSIGLVSKSALNGTQVETLSKKTLVDFCHLTGVPKDKCDVANISEYYATTSNYKLNEGFFAKMLFLVEGETEELCFPLLFKQFSINVNSAGIAVLAVNGKNQIPKYWRLFKSFGINTEIIIDNDDMTDEKKRNNSNIAFCFNTDENSICQIDDGDSIKILSTSNANVFDQRIFILKTDFEATLKQDYETYCELNNFKSNYDEFEIQAREYIKPVGSAQKGPCARYIVNNIFKEHPDYKPKFVESIINTLGINSVTNTSSQEQITSEVSTDENDDLPF